MIIAVSGSTGALGTHVVDALLERHPADQIVALARDTAKAAPLADRGVVIREADYDRPDTLAAALAGVDRLLLISGNDLVNRVAQHRAVIDAAREAGATRLVYTSVLGAGATTLPIASDHVQTEEYLAASAIPSAVLRNGWYNENYLPTMDSVAQTGTLVTNAGEGRVASAARADYAEAAAIVLTADAVQPVYELSGDIAWTQDQLGAAIAEVLGTQVSVQHVSAEEHARILVQSGAPEAMTGYFTGMDTAIADGALAVHAGELGALLGRPTTPLIDTLRTGR